VLEYDTEMSFTKQMNNLVSIANNLKKDKGLDGLNNQNEVLQDPEKRSWIIQELLESEKKYLRSLEQLEEVNLIWRYNYHFYFLTSFQINDSVQQEILETKALQAIRFEISMIFGNITEIYQKHAAFADCLKSRESDIDMCLGQILTDNVSSMHKDMDISFPHVAENIFCQLEEFSKPYYLYLSNRSKAIEIHQKLMSKSSKYKKMIMVCITMSHIAYSRFSIALTLTQNIERLSGTDTEKVSISSLLIEPVQRIPRYTLLIDGMISFILRI
jgi:hypothetical protein